MRPKQQTTIPENPHKHILVMVLFCPKPYFRVVKQENKLQHVNLCIFPPHLHIKFIKFGARLFSYEINHFNKLFSKINANSILNILNMGESSIL